MTWETSQPKLSIPRASLSKLGQAQLRSRAGGLFLSLQAPQIQEATLSLVNTTSRSGSVPSPCGSTHTVDGINSCMTLNTKTSGIMLEQYRLGDAGFTSSTVVVGEAGSRPKCPERRRAPCEYRFRRGQKARGLGGDSEVTCLLP